tara:strand:+ start:423 stop:1211 length:789 start_codon:yes stop_codon:yes gene_type:complete
MTWAEFKTAVRVYLTVDGGRLNIQDYIDRMILSSVIDIQSYIPYYRIHGYNVFSTNGTIKDSEPLADSQKASAGTLEGDIRITDVYFFDGAEDFDWDSDLSVPSDENDPCYQYPLTVWPWANRNDLLCGVAEGHRAIAIHPNGINFIIYPQVALSDKVEIYYQSIDRSFADSDTVPFSEEEVIQAVAEHVKSKLAREVDRDLSLYTSYLASYHKMRQRIYLDTRDRKKVAYNTVSPLSDIAVKHFNKGCADSSVVTSLTSCS